MMKDKIIYIGKRFSRLVKSGYCMLYAIGAIGLALSWRVHGCADLYVRRYNQPVLICGNGKVEMIDGEQVRQLVLPQLPKRYRPISVAVSQSALCVLARYTEPPTNEPYKSGTFSFGEEKEPPERDGLLVITGGTAPRSVFINIKGSNVALAANYVFVENWQLNYAGRPLTDDNATLAKQGPVAAVALADFKRTELNDVVGVRGTPGASRVAMLRRNGSLELYRDLVPLQPIVIPTDMQIDWKRWDYASTSGELATIVHSLGQVAVSNGQHMEVHVLPPAVPCVSATLLKIEPASKNIWFTMFSGCFGQFQIAAITHTGSYLGKVTHRASILIRSFQPLSPVEVRFLQRLQKNQPFATRRL